MENKINLPVAIEVEDATHAFLKTIDLLCFHGTESAPRGQKIKELMHYTMRIKNPKARYVNALFKASKKYLAAEMVYYFWNRYDLKGIGKHSDFWNHISDDGETIRSAYGYIIREKHGFDQIQYVIDMLRKDPDTRKAVIQLKTPYQHETKDNICTLALNFHIRNGKLHMHSIMRGNDIVFGFRYNVYFFTMIQEMIAKELEIEMGTMTHTVSSMHIYEKHMYLGEKLYEELDDYYALKQTEFINEPNKLLMDSKENIIHEYIRDEGDKGMDELVVPKYSDLQDELEGNFKDEKSVFKKFYEILKTDAQTYIKEEGLGGQNANSN